MDGRAGHVTEARMTCPACGAKARETMPTDACRVVWDCPSCGAQARPRPGDCCVYCSYADVRCPPEQQTGGSASAG